MNTTGGVVLRPSDIRNIKSFIAIKYSDKPSNERSEIVAEAIRQIIWRELPDFSEQVKKQLTAELIRQSIMGQNTVVSRDDIFSICLKLDMSEESIIHPLAEWLHQQLNGAEHIEHSFEANALRQLIGQMALASQESSGLLTAERPSLFSARDRLSDMLLSFQPGLDEGLTSSGAGALPGLSNKYIRFVKPLSTVLSLLLLGGTLGLSSDKCAVQGCFSVAEQWGEAGSPAITAAAKGAVPASSFASRTENSLPESLQYTDIDVARLAAYLETRSSLLAKPKYLNPIVAAAKEYNVHPLLLVAITGQEQGFVPSDHKEAATIANNPFNVYTSWQEFNTSIDESSRIAAKTVVNLSKERPEGVDPIVWINRKYAADPNWSIGVRKLFDMLRDKTAAR